MAVPGRPSLPILLQTPPLSRFTTAHNTEMRFRARLSGGAREVRFERADMGAGDA